MIRTGWDQSAPGQFRSAGSGVLVSHGAFIADPGLVTCGDNVRIDPFVYISGEVRIGSNVQICAGAVLGGSAGIVLGDWTFVGYGSKLFTGSEDYRYLVNEAWGASHVDRRPIEFKDFAGVASDVIVMPGVTLNPGVRIGAHSFVYRSPLGMWAVYMGNPLRRVKDVIRNDTVVEAADLEAT